MSSQQDGLSEELDARFNRLEGILNELFRNLKKDPLRGVECPWCKAIVKHPTILNSGITTVWCNHCDQYFVVENKKE